MNHLKNWSQKTICNVQDMKSLGANDCLRPLFSAYEGRRMNLNKNRNILLSLANITEMTRNNRTEQKLFL